MDWKSILGAVAPTVAAVLGGPLAGLAVEALGSALGMEQPTVDKVKDALTASTMTGEQVAALKLAELNLVVKLKELDIKVEEIATADRSSARLRETIVKDGTNKVLAFLVVGGFMAMVGTTLAGWSAVDGALAGTLVGYLSAKAEQVLSYYFGSTKGSAEKTAAMVESARQR